MWARIFIVGVLLLIATFGLYAYNLHALALESNRIFGYRCTHVNPPLIAYKQSFLKYADFLNTYPNTSYTPDEVQGFIDGYIDGMRKYIPEEAKWIAMQKEYVNRWDFMLLEPDYMQILAKYQLQMYQGYLDDAQGMIDMVDNPELAKTVSAEFTSEQRQRRNMYEKLYWDTFDQARDIADIRKIFGQVPIPDGCTEENTTIPDTAGAINWDRPSSIPSDVPIDPDAAT